MKRVLPRKKRTPPAKPEPTDLLARARQAARAELEMLRDGPEERLDRRTLLTGFRREGL